MLTRGRLLGLMTIILLLAADQLSKWYVSEFVFRPALGLGDGMLLGDWYQYTPERLSNISLSITSFFNLTLVWNEGISFGLFSSGGWGLLTVASLVIAAFFVVWMMRALETLEIMGLAMVIGGALGNVIDRVRFGAVLDFLDFYVGNWHPFIFNVADSAISVGVVLLLIHGLFFAKKSV